MTLEIDSNFRDLEVYLQSRRPAIRAQAQKLADRYVLEHNGKMIRDGFVGYKGHRNTGSTLQKRSGALRNSLRTQRTDTTGEVQSSSYVAGPLAYARIQEFGGVVKPRRRRYLTVPTKAALTPAGVVRQAARPTKVGGKWMTNGQVPGLKGRETFIRRSGSGDPVIFGMGRDGRPVALWTLKRSVKVPARFGFFRTWEALEAKRQAQLDKAGLKMLEGGADA